MKTGMAMRSKTLSIAIPIQKGLRTHSQDQVATGGTASNFKMMKTMPTTAKHPRPLDVDLDIYGPFYFDSMKSIA